LSNMDTGPSLSILRNLPNNYKSEYDRPMSYSSVCVTYPYFKGRNYAVGVAFSIS
jgi:hypothetical protein